MSDMDLLQTRDVVTAPWPVGPTLHDELMAVQDYDLVLMMTLTPEQTGVPFAVWISTDLGEHGPRVKGYVGRHGRHEPSFSMSISGEPEIEVSSYNERETRRAAALLEPWVRLNHEALLDYWYNGTEWFDPQVRAFVDALKKV
jgi:hypothetical protein